ncbi:MAG: methyltransferase domain-containing protein [Trueperaceae bacterium]|nr:methyltransferase domain-containing protein [Trueperaceae bacterium]
MPEPRFQAPKTRVFELEVLQGLVPFVLNEILDLAGAKMIQKNEESIRFLYAAKTEKLSHFRKAIAVYLVSQFAIPRPKALLGNQQFAQLLSAIRWVMAEQPFQSFRFEAAGKDSSVFNRLAEELSKALEIPFEPEEGELMLRVRPFPDGWEVLIRLTPRPLSARPWRVCNMAGGLNASLAAVMNELARPKPHERYLNAMCGSGTLLIEQALKSPCKALTGVDIRQEALDCARKNLNAAALSKVQLINADITKYELEQPFDVITADLPWGDAIGSHKANAELYPAFLAAVARGSSHHARLVILTHEIKLFETLLKKDKNWTLKQSIRVSHSGHYPRIYLLHKV